MMTFDPSEKTRLLLLLQWQLNLFEPIPWAGWLFHLSRYQLLVELVQNLIEMLLENSVCSDGAPFLGERR